ncbi:flavoprotein [Streptomyces sp. CRN 30]|uniref:flavoprotein n=1 Tax=Streptomyces sp. CRN 30 TaxID=3075613 RepID=UPI002A829766|nr:flavoprotein [Streptomyces sp. CRN 30]
MTVPISSDLTPFLYVIVCGCGNAGDIGTLIDAAQKRHWDVGVIATPQGFGFIDAEAIATLTGYPVRSAWHAPGDARSFPPADAIAVAPASFNTVNKWAAGICDTLALSVLCESHGLGTPTAVLPYVNSALAAHPAYRRSLELLRETGVLIGTYEPHRPKAGGGAHRFPWHEALDLLEPRLGRRPVSGSP